MELATFNLRVGQRLGVVPTSGSLSPEDGELVESAYALLLEELANHGMAWWSVEEAIPDEFADILIGMTAARLVDDFTIDEPRRSYILAQSAFGLATPSIDERRLRRLTALGPEARPRDEQQADYY